MGYKVGIVGATGLVGTTFLKVLEERDFPIDELYLFASARSAGKQVEFRGKTYTIEELTERSFDREMDYALFSAGGDISKKYSPIASRNNVVVIDNSSAFRMDEDVPLIVPEVNPDAAMKHKNIIANPNCSTIQAVVPLKVLDDRWSIKRVVYSTYQAVSGSGLAGIRDLEDGIRGEEPKNYPHPIAYNCLPHIDVFMENGNTKEEEKMIGETRKILEKPNLPVSATCVRVPVKHGHSISVNVELEKEFEIEEVRRALSETPGIILMDDPSNNIYPMPISVEGKDEVFVGRVRRDESLVSGLNLWIVADNIRKGAATNTVQIAELLIREGKN
ncbi:aspartate-semialdehyde dehydrogenase [Propionigenium maris DSM 9537]|uniref:Aspartate-semialdehyde dehydrogenase n=1 Tax=Propionigenium maris DSM 9537 TaxID=1123000 RepID=A0A9W6LN59_9FUSO|nr:aspartate-semialdehyde dehydrogenase [Propionigenium maris]GLI56253.1 aspartate-semialdehyde dehydrogenase [Propionigenium maris DSM 9537]